MYIVINILPLGTDSPMGFTRTTRRDLGPWDPLTCVERFGKFNDMPYGLHWAQPQTLAGGGWAP